MAHSRPSTSNVFTDVWDGQNSTDNVLLKTESTSLALILYQDAFEVVNPLGSGRKKHKVLAVYLTFGDISLVTLYLLTLYLLTLSLMTLSFQLLPLSLTRLGW